MTLDTQAWLALAATVATVSAWGTGLGVQQRSIIKRLDAMNGTLAHHLDGHPPVSEIVVQGTLDALRLRADDAHADLRREIDAARKRR